MTQNLDRRMKRMSGPAMNRLVESKWIIWCAEVEHMPAMIDLLIALGSLSESDRPHCVHWTDVKEAERLSQEEIGKAVDAEEMLAKAGIRTLFGQSWDAYMEGPETLEDFFREAFGELDADHLEFLKELEKGADLIRGGA